MEQEKIPFISQQLMMGAAIVFDVIQALIGLTNAIPAVGQGISLIGGYAVSIFATLTFGTWFAVRGVNFFQGRKAGKRMAALACEYIPLLNSLPIPGWSLAVWFTIHQAKEEDKEQKKREKKGSSPRYAQDRRPMQRASLKNGVQYRKAL